ncbi:hypothetical protein LCGC14_1984630 [marine sediment metagenome]|uniref:Uncharacterized protein n=1 Tax=marine sediment metagenome TaxID=412755 RepID=A0A0F9HL46_9ZZZZ
MPYIYGKDNSRMLAKCFVKWGKSGKKYFYTCGSIAARKRAKAKANKQRTAIFSSGWTKK